MHSQWCSDFFFGVKAIIPLAIGVGMYGLAFGLLATQADFSWINTGMMGVLVFAGSAQIVAVERLVAGASIMTAFIAGFALNLRLILITASIRDFFANRPLWQRILGAHLTSDENWALTLAKRSEGLNVGYWFLVGAGLTIMLVWMVAGILGVIFHPIFPILKSMPLILRLPPHSLLSRDHFGAANRIYFLG